MGQEYSSMNIEERSGLRVNAIKLVELIDTLDEGVERHGL